MRAGRAEVIPLCPIREVVGRWHGVAVSTAMTLWLLFVIRACLGMDLASWRCAGREGDDEAGISGLAGGVALTRESRGVCLYMYIVCRVPRVGGGALAYTGKTVRLVDDSHQSHHVSGQLTSRVPKKGIKQRAMTNEPITSTAGKSSNLA